MENISGYLENWRTFYAVLAGSSATLMGLIFVSVSLHPNLFGRETISEPKQIAWQTFINFFWVFTISVVFLVPGLTGLSMGLIVEILGIAGTIIACRRWWRARTHLSLGRALVAFVPLLVCYVSILVSGLLTIGWSYNALTIIAPVAIVLIAISVHDAWDLLIGSREHSSK
jgi:hypothetical protein